MRLEERHLTQEGNTVISIKQKGSFKRLDNFLKRMVNRDYLTTLNAYGAKGVIALSQATPRDSGKTASSWKYDIYHQKGKAKIVWSNTNINDGVNIAIILQYGHGTKNGAYVEGIDYINPAMRPIFESIANAAWKEVTK